MEPFLKWAGGKRWLVNKAASLIPKLEENNKYVEPFLGGGSMYFHIKPSKAILSDINYDLINAYVAIRDNWEALYKILTQYHAAHSPSFYYKMRASLPEENLDKAARFIYLNRTCWNGLYRVNLKGEFNVPIGTKTNVISGDDNFEQLSRQFNNVDIITCDFELSIDRADRGDFVFVDPPYTVKHNLNGFVKYNEKIFSWEDQIRLRNSIVRAVNRGAFVLITNANHRSIDELYQDIGEKILLNRASVIAGKSTARGMCSELAIKCW